MPEKPSNPKDLPAINKDGTIHASSGIGPIKHSPRKPPLDLEEAKNRGLLPESALSFDPNDPESLANIGYRKFTPARQRLYLDKLAEHGRHKLAALIAGVTPQCVERFAREDKEFAMQREIAADAYHEVTAGIILAQVRQGMQDIRKDKDGNITSIRTSYETQLRKMMLTRADPSYTETQKSEVAVTGGAVIVPPPTDVEDWQATVAKWTGKPTVDTSGEPMPAPKLGPADE